MLEDLLLLQDDPEAPPVVVDEAVGEHGLVFRPALKHVGYHPGVLASLVEHGLIDLTQVSDLVYRVYVTPVGRDCYDDMCGLT